MKHFIVRLMLPFFLLIPPSGFTSELLLKQFFNDVETLQATFDQRILDETGAVIDVSNGTLYLSRPGKFRWDYEGYDPELPTGQQIIADGESIFLFDPDLEQVTQRRLEDALGQVPSLMLVQSGSNLTEYFSVTDFGLTDDLSWVAVQPKAPNAAYQQLMIGFKESELNTITLVDGIGNETRLTLSQVKTNLALSDDVFRFDVPEGVDILSE